MVVLVEVVFEIIGSCLKHIVLYMVAHRERQQEQGKVRLLNGKDC